MNFNIHEGLSVLLFVSLLFVSCNSNHGSDVNRGENLSKNSKNDSIGIAGKDVLGTDTGIMIKEVNQKTIYLYGIWQQIPTSGIKEVIKNNAALIVGKIIKKKLSMEGGLTLLYKKVPSAVGLDVFVGIPVGSKSVQRQNILQLSEDGFVILELPAAKYFQASVNAEPGQTINAWSHFLKVLNNRNLTAPTDFESKFRPDKTIPGTHLNAKTYPYYEYFKDSRNAEMATTVYQATLMMKRP